MKHQVLIILSILSIINKINCNCGCLKCSKDLQVISPPYCPYKVIVKGNPCGGGGGGKPSHWGPQPPLPYIPITPKLFEQQVKSPYQTYAYKYQMQTPVISPPASLIPPITGLVAKPDRLVIQQPPLNYAANYDDSYFAPPCTSIFNGFYGVAAPAPPPRSFFLGQPRIGPVLEPLADVYRTLNCDCRYGRKKRELPILRDSVNFLMGLLPKFLRLPIEQTLKSLKYQQTFDRGYYRPKVRTHPKKVKPSETFLQKLQKLNRVKRSLIFDNDKLSLPFLRVTDVENEIEESEEEDESEEEAPDPAREYLRPLNFNHLVPHNPIYYLLNAPIRFLHHFHQLGQQISPVFKSVPLVFINSRKYLRNFGKNFKNGVLNFASDLIGDFDDVNAHSYKYLRPKRDSRSLDGRKLEQYEPDYSLVFGNETEENVRQKRYILKVVDEDEVEQFLKQKLGGLIQPPEHKKKIKEKEKDGKKRRLVVERLAPKLIIDNNGRPFVEINGVKRPLFLNKKKPEEVDKPEEKKDEDQTENMKDKINFIISKARERMGQNPVVGTQHNVPNQMIKERINQILTEIQDLINLDFEKYAKIHSDLCKLQSFKELLETEWKKILMEDRANDISSKIRLLDEFKEMQILKDKCVEDIASILSTGSNFMTKKLIKMLVRLQKLQCIIYRVVEDFGEKIKMGTEFDVRKEIKYVDYLTSLHFIVGKTQYDLESDLKRERDVALENEMRVLESLRKLLEENHHDPQKMSEEAQLLWEIKNIDKLQKDAILEMNGKISRGQKVRKELKILFDLLRQLENCEEKQKKVFEELVPQNRHPREEQEEEEEEEVVRQKRRFFPKEEPKKQGKRSHHQGNVRFGTNAKNRTFRRRIAESTILNRSKNFPHKTILEDKKPVKIVSNGYAMTAYKVSDGFD